MAAKKRRRAVDRGEEVFQNESLRSAERLHLEQVMSDRIAAIETRGMSLGKGQASVAGSPDTLGAVRVEGHAGKALLREIYRPNQTSPESSSPVDVGRLTRFNEAAGGKFYPWHDHASSEPVLVVIGQLVRLDRRVQDVEVMLRFLVERQP